MAPAQMLQRAADRIRGVVPGVATDTSLLHDPGDKDTKTIAELTDGAKADNLLTEAIQAIDSSVIPAYQALVASAGRTDTTMRRR